MKKASKVLLLLSALCLMTSCSGGTQHLEHLKGHLKDPESLNVKSEEKRVNDGNPVYKVVYNAKNSFGGYTSFDTIYIYYDDAEWICSHCESLPGYCSVMFSTAD